MAENESLDLGNPGGQRWNRVRDAVRKRKPPEEVAHKVSRKLPAALKKAFKEFIDAGVSLEQLLANRNNSQNLDRLVRKSDGHEYAHLFAACAASEVGGDNGQVINSFLNGIVDRVMDQIVHDVVGTEYWPDISSVRDYLPKVRQHLSPDIRWLEKKLVEDPNWTPTARRKKREDANSAMNDLLKMSILGVAKK